MATEWPTFSRERNAGMKNFGDVLLVRLHGESGLEKYIVEHSNRERAIWCLIIHFKLEYNTGMNKR